MKRRLINLFIVLYLVTTVCWAIPFNSRLRTRVVKLTSPGVLWIGLWQNWDLFAPNPRSSNVYLEAEVTFQDGKKMVWRFPRMEELGIVESSFKERYRRWANDNVRMDSKSQLWPDAARFIARLHASPHNPPQTVRLVRYLSVIDKPYAVGYGKLLPATDSWKSTVFFTYDVQPDDLR